MKSQADEILEYLDVNGSITQAEATHYIGCARLAARCGELKKAGHRITTDMVAVKNRHGHDVSIARYRLERVVNGQVEMGI